MAIFFFFVDFFEFLIFDEVFYFNVLNGRKKVSNNLNIIHMWNRMFCRFKYYDSDTGTI